MAVFDLGGSSKIAIPTIAFKNDAMVRCQKIISAAGPNTIIGGVRSASSLPSNRDPAPLVRVSRRCFRRP